MTDSIGCNRARDGSDLSGPPNPLTLSSAGASPTRIEGRTQPFRQCWCRPHPKTELSGPFDTPRRSVGALRVNGLCDYGPTPNSTLATAAPSRRRKRESVGWAAFLSATLNSYDARSIFSPQPDSLPQLPHLVRPAGVTGCFRCHNDAPCRGWIPAFADLCTTVIPAAPPSFPRRRDLCTTVIPAKAGIQDWGFPARKASHLRHAVSHRGSYAKVPRSRE